MSLECSFFFDPLEKFKETRYWGWFGCVFGGLVEFAMKPSGPGLWGT